MLTDDENQKILMEEMESIKNDIIQIYNSSGKRTTGEFESGLQIEYNGLTAVLKGYTYLGGRRPGKMPPLDAIEKWIEASSLMGYHIYTGCINLPAISGKKGVIKGYIALIYACLSCAFAKPL